MEDVITVRVSRDVRDIMHKAAVHLGLSLSTFVRMAALERAREVTNDADAKDYTGIKE